MKRNDPKWWKKVAAIYDSKKEDLNWKLQRRGVIHHHNGLCLKPIDLAKIGSEDGLLRLLHKQENQLTLSGLKHLGRIRPSMTGLDAGCGRGGSSLMIASQTGCRMTGISVSPYQVKTARRMASIRRLSARVKFLRGNMLRFPFADGSFDFIWACESTEHVPRLEDWFRRSSRLCVKDGRMVVIAWVKDLSRPGARRAARLTDSAYVTKVHEDAEYEPPRDCGWKKVGRVDFTAAAARYWRLRSRSAHATGTEKFMTPAFASGAMRYFLYVYRKS
jgi:geranyl diphosphate 2-C-methyltransferase